MSLTCQIQYAEKVAWRKLKKTASNGGTPEVGRRLRAGLGKPPCGHSDGIAAIAQRIGRAFRGQTVEVAAKPHMERTV
jgi:hypothetical protein